VSVLEWLNGKDAYRGRVAAFAEWDCFPLILNAPRSGLFVNAGIEPVAGSSLSEREKTLNQVLLDTTWPHADQRSDALTFLMAQAYFERTTPRVLYLSFGETDEWAHEGATTSCSSPRTGSTATSRDSGRKCSRCPRTQARRRS
jgi:hypothetical protein